MWAQTSVAHRPTLLNSQRAKSIHHCPVHHWTVLHCLSLWIHLSVSSPSLYSPSLSVLVNPSVIVVLVNPSVSVQSVTVQSFIVCPCESICQCPVRCLSLWIRLSVSSPSLYSPSLSVLVNPSVIVVLVNPSVSVQSVTVQSFIVCPCESICHCCPCESICQCPVRHCTVLHCLSLWICLSVSSPSLYSPSLSVLVNPSVIVQSVTVQSFIVCPCESICHCPVHRCTVLHCPSLWIHLSLSSPSLYSPSLSVLVNPSVNVQSITVQSFTVCPCESICHCPVRHCTVIHYLSLWIHLSVCSGRGFTLIVAIKSVCLCVCVGRLVGSWVLVMGNVVRWKKSGRL